ILREHMRQIGNVGRHRGHFVRVSPGTSRRPMYFAPALASLLGPLLGLRVLARLPRFLRVPALAAAYGALAASCPRRGIPVRLAFPVALVAHHLAYGVSFVRGLLTRTMDR
ncbi:MAG: hypothetical protein RLN63_10270, partial [Miltoncostaeaceae bacterium]